ncbi:Arm DNA-binding domain-containing protein [Pediococcus pentosaceus]|uniref:Arm DNA-binding domain-containing protein n=1 Tax=Pediococcus pentosaceus TaxID=1255 RepID=UPI0035C9B61D
MEFSILIFPIYAGIDPQTGKKKKTRRRGFKTRKEANLALSRLTLDLDIHTVQRYFRLERTLRKSNSV